MKPKITIASTSFVLPKNSAWRALQPLGDLTFADYGDYAGSLMRAAPDETLVFIVFVQDLVRDGGAPGGSADAVEPLISLIERRAAAAREPTIVAITSWSARSVVSSAKNGDPASAMSHRLWAGLQRMRDAHATVLAIDLDRQLGVDGFAKAFDSRNWYFAHCRLSQAGLAIVAKSVASVLERRLKPRKKVLVLDCDNTLWGGVVGEEGWERVALGEEGIGAAYMDFQRVAKRLAAEGILLALASKNDESVVWEVFDRHGSMALRRDDLVAFKINWNDKTVSLRELADELDLGLDAFVFWDDSPFERAMVKAALPAVEVVDVPEDVTRWPQLLANLESLQAFSYTTEDRKKTEQYKSRAQFSRDRGGVRDEADFLDSIKMVPCLHTVDEGTLARAHQLALKTNQFNLRSVRYSREEITALAADPRNVCVLASLSDIYGDHGLVALAICREIAAGTAFLDTLLMSCRVLGRHFESWVLASVADRLRARGVSRLVAEYIPTDRNAMCAATLAEHNFSPLESGLAPPELEAIAAPGGRRGTRYIIDLEIESIPNDVAWQVNDAAESGGGSQGAAFGA
jgi:FkbH-like protein